jgi:hypothetical protein
MRKERIDLKARGIVCAVKRALTPIVLDSVGFVTTGDYSEELHELAANGAGGFLAVWVILPSLLGMSTHWILGEKRVALISPYLKLSNFGVLALLNYSNASINLPGRRTQQSEHPVERGVIG